MIKKVTSDSSWEEIMEAVEAVERMSSTKYGRFIVTIKEDCCLIQSTNKTKESSYSRMMCLKNKKESVVESLKPFFEKLSL